MCKPGGDLASFDPGLASNPRIRCMHCTHSTFSACCAPGRATNPAIRCIAWGIFSIFAQTRATNLRIVCKPGGDLGIFDPGRAQNPWIRRARRAHSPFLSNSAQFSATNRRIRRATNECITAALLDPLFPPSNRVWHPGLGRVVWSEQGAIAVRADVVQTLCVARSSRNEGRG
jgi:hypothetical protein